MIKVNFSFSRRTYSLQTKTFFFCDAAQVRFAGEQHIHLQGNFALVVYRVLDRIVHDVTLAENCTNENSPIVKGGGNEPGQKREGI